MAVPQSTTSGNVIASALSKELEHEAVSTRALLERIPQEAAEWKPHPKSMTLGQLATHVAEIPGYTIPVVQRTELDLNPVEGKAHEPKVFRTASETAALLDKNVQAALAALRETSDEQMQVSWSLKNAGHTVFCLPRAAVLRTLVMSHLIHHRGQLTVYLRLQNVPLPSVYGPSGDTAG